MVLFVTHNENSRASYGFRKIMSLATLNIGTLKDRERGRDRKGKEIGIRIGRDKGHG